MESSSQSTQRSMPGGSTDGQRKPPPVPYHSTPFDYDPDVLCFCKLKAARLISWIDTNPCLRYYRCRRRWSGEGCTFYQWHDPESDKYMKRLLLDLRDTIYDLRDQNAILEQQLKEANGMNDVLVTESAEKSASLKKLQRKLAERDADAVQQAMPRKISAWNCSCFIVLVLALLFGLVLSLVGPV
ncbi:hypothetical protein BS78_01G492000 [Paspalum vaginatum]|nr:hypothetical protein BS78_01G492000 [Paspalum vaginatum]KAJ1298933.1 hypothetical protein BS78_01G492000 [Paspalum vaginatum]KAJ1298934.1 hypothetical protein BS78_01G492000 [Paspalum vaginatum]